MPITMIRREVEHGHTKECLAKTIIAAIENIRDMEGETDHDFRLAAQDNYFLTIADEYLKEGTATCICPVIWTEVGGGVYRCPNCARTDWLSNFRSQGCDCGLHE